MDMMNPTMNPTQVLALLILISMESGVSAQTAPVVAPAEQIARDGERLTILLQERNREQVQATEATKRRAERLAAGDAAGVAQAEQAQRTAAANLQALDREIRAAQPASKASAAAPPIPPSGPTSGVWWDVYGKGPRSPTAAATADPPNPPSSAPVLPAQVR
jgi:hypothetical protein